MGTVVSVAEMVAAVETVAAAVETEIAKEEAGNQLTSIYLLKVSFYDAFENFTLLVFPKNKYSF